MNAGRLYPPESRRFSDPLTGVTVRQLTSAPAVHHPPFYYVPAMDDAMRHLVFVSYRSGRPEVFLELCESGRLLQLTEAPAINPWSVHPSHDGRFVHFTAGAAACRVDTERLEIEVVVDFRSVFRGPVDTKSGIGTTSVSCDDRWWAVPVRCGPVTRLVIVDLQTGSSECILERDTILHPQFHPSDSGLLRYAGSHDERLWVVGRDGGGNRLVFRRDRSRRQWIVHETWLPGGFEILFTDWPHGVHAVDVSASRVRRVAAFNAWHPMVNRTGTMAVADTNHPDIGLQLFDPLDGVGVPRALCVAESSNLGEQWKTDHCPYDDGFVSEPAPQHTHPHPSFTPDGRSVVFTSDRSGYAQVYVADLTEDLMRMAIDGKA